MAERILSAAGWLSVALMTVGYIAAFTPYRLSAGLLFPVGLTIFWLVGVVSRRRSALSEGDGK
jgi:hypothetical protein